ncbi:MAG: hypothetical protein IT371_09775 [Deltaproteobacteria bacterium]|nr:hypothetical protein [Deltaproteobacteria bacterium]
MPVSPTTSTGALAAFENRPAQFNTFGVPKEDLPPKNDGELVNATWGVQAPYGQGSNLYALVEPKKAANDRLVPELVLVSSASPEAYTWVELRLPPVGTKVDDPSKYISSQLGPPSAKPDAGSTTGPDSGGAVSPDAGAAATVDASSPAPGSGGSGGCSVPAAPSMPSSERAFFAALCLSALALGRARRRPSRSAVDVNAPRE